MDEVRCVGAGVWFDEACEDGNDDECRTTRVLRFPLRLVVLLSYFTALCLVAVV